MVMPARKLSDFVVVHSSAKGVRGNENEVGKAGEALGGLDKIRVLSVDGVRSTHDLSELLEKRQRHERAFIGGLVQEDDDGRAGLR